ncbi:hypothetical protein SA87_01590 [Hydrogenibacillus schlegelii]|uniref:adenine deaminase n=2 Tax=Hydrogenibacillus schlegelii TaxID=1484 RepID=A0A179IM56_HYDSH|nr:hypothetical protein SA87_01590 [Hydrogenibacillus schlegelii]
MMKRPKRLRPPSARERAALIRVARREAPADVWLSGGVVLNVFTGEWLRAEVAFLGRRIAYVGPEAPRVGPETRLVDVRDRVLVPGYIEPHAHPFQLYHPWTLADYVLGRGTTMLIADNMMLFQLLPLPAWERLMAAFSAHPVKFLWWARTTPQAHDGRLSARYAPEHLAALAVHPFVVQAGELTDFVPLAAGDEAALARLSPFIEAEKRIESHAPGASYETLLRLALAGATADHEAIDGEELLRRLRLGYFAPLRHSSIRPDLPELVRAALEVPAAWTRLMLTTDGATPPALTDGFLDRLIALALEAGAPPAWAYRWATLNVAEYYRLDDAVGAIAPGRLADVNVLASPSEPTPLLTWVEGRPASELRLPEPAWERLVPEARRQKVRPAPLRPDDFLPPGAPGAPQPIVHLHSDVITVLAERPLPVRGDRIDPAALGGTLHLAALVDRDGRWVTAAVMSGLGEGSLAVASTFTASADVLVLASSPERALEAYRAVVERPGIVWRIGVGAAEEAGFLPLPLFGRLSDLAMPELIERTEAFVRAMRKAGFPHRDPLYMLLFLSSTHLPRVRLTERGLLSVKDGRILSPVRRLSGPAAGGTA